MNYFRRLARRWFYRTMIRRYTGRNARLSRMVAELSRRLTLVEKHRDRLADEYADCRQRNIVSPGDVQPPLAGCYLVLLSNGEWTGRCFVKAGWWLEPTERVIAWRRFPARPDFIVITAEIRNLLLAGVEP